jgi:hypothetical protein
MSAELSAVRNTRHRVAQGLDVGILVPVWRPSHPCVDFDKNQPGK